MDRLSIVKQFAHDCEVSGWNHEDWEALEESSIEDQFALAFLEELDSANDLQKELTDFASTTFWGNNSRIVITDQVITKMLAEVEELKDAIERFDSTRGITHYLTSGRKIAEEAADVSFMLYQLAELYGFHLEDEVRAKLQTNKNRKWELQPDGTYQHVRENQ